MKFQRTAKAIAGLTVATAIALGGVSEASAATKVTFKSKSALAAACKKNGGESYGTSRAYGCTKSHADGSSDTIECSKGKCLGYHFDPPA